MDNNGTFNLPDYFDKTLWCNPQQIGVSSYGEIPNITGSFVPWAYGNAATSGVFTNSGAGTSSSWGTQDVHQGTIVYFNANNASSVYTNNISRVMPAVVAVQFLVKYI